MQHDLKDYLQGKTMDSLLEEEIKKAVQNKKEKPKSAHPEQIKLPFDMSGEILVAEDQLINRKVITQFLERKGLKVRNAENGKQAVEMYTQNPDAYFMILMDVQMPVMDGFEATKMIRTLEEKLNIHIPIVAMTAHAMKGDKEKCLAVGMDHYLSKPVNPDELYSVVEKYRK